LYVLPIIAFLAIASSYFGHFAGTREGFCGIMMQIITWAKPNLKKEIDPKKVKFAGTITIAVLLWCFAVYNWSVLSIMGVVSAPIIAMYAYLMPVILMKKVPRLRIYRSKLAMFVFIVGVVTIVGYCLSQVM
jgi:serine transporter